MIVRLIAVMLSRQPRILRRLFRRMYNWALANRSVYQLVSNAASLQCCHDYWRNPSKINRPETYLTGELQSKYLVSLIRKYAKREARILEIGCNVGRNMNALYLAGYRNIEGIEISKQAVDLMRVSFPTLNDCRVYNAAVEDVIETMPHESYDVVYTMETLKHIHRDSDWVFKEMTRIVKGVLITIECEKGMSWCIFPRNYKVVFEQYGMAQIEEGDCSEIPQLCTASVRVFRNVDGSTPVS